MSTQKNLPDFTTVTEFEQRVAKFFGAPYAVAVDSCTSGLRIGLEFVKDKHLTIPTRTYLSVPMMALQARKAFVWDRDPWKDYYYLASNLIDAAVLWRKNSYIPGTLMSLSFQQQKHLSLGRGGMLLVPDRFTYDRVVKLSYDGRERGVPWREQNVSIMGYHAYMTPETAAAGLEKLPAAIKAKPRQWEYTDWPDLTEMEVFKWLQR